MRWRLRRPRRGRWIVPSWRGRGCLRCAGRGVSGRVGVFEMMMPDAQIASLIAAGVPASELVAALRAQGVESLADDAIAKVLSGTTSISEVLQVMIES